MPAPDARPAPGSELAGVGGGRRKHERAQGMTAPRLDRSPPDRGPATQSCRRRVLWRALWRALPLIVLAVGLVLFFALGLEHDFTLTALRQNRHFLMGWAATHTIAAPVAFTALYLVATAFCIPIATPLSLVGGFLFGPVAGTLWVVLGATGGATLLFLAARTALRQILAARAGPRLRRLEAGFAANALSYMLFLRLMPVFPFWLVNLAPALLGVRLRVFVLGTFLGIVPGAFVYAFLGSGIGGILDAPANAGKPALFTPEIVAALGLLALLSLLPVAYRASRHGRDRGHGQDGREGKDG